ncbi:hypothetical protein [Legionella cincinnatiensis]|uniref:Coiled-coil protein n=1 Tax=Legionella cincinnatiensis TaxID=28085 RepID=A0A378IUE9_9GAMM|nr:hypothetical protein [Legionella cincinnatiensis]KTC83234.1 coiled-coil protein [Legionella cincinnatiensis]STX35634.1 coiled-coil protein [Legionella cincinnatiensis]
MNSDLIIDIEEYNSQYKNAGSLAEKLEVIVAFKSYIASFNDGFFGPEVDENDENEVIQKLEIIEKDLNEYCLKEGISGTNINDMCEKRQQVSNLIAEVEILNNREKKVEEKKAQNTLTQTIANAYHIYDTCQKALLEKDYVLPSEKEELQKTAEKYMNIMKTLCNRTNNTLTLIAAKRVYQAINNEDELPKKLKLDGDKYNLVPNESIKLNKIPAENNATSTAKYRWRRTAKLALAKERGQLLEVNEVSKQQDISGQTKMLEPKERDPHRALIRDGKIVRYDRELTTTTPVDTADMLSHGKGGYCAFTINADGDMYLFNHKDKTDKVAHSTMTEGGLVLGAGEMQIKNGQIEVITCYSGHYRPGVKNIYETLKYLAEKNVDISQIKVSFLDEPKELNTLTKETINLPERVVHSSGELRHIEEVLSDISHEDRQTHLGLRYIYNAQDIVNHMNLLSKQQTIKENLSEIKNIEDPNKTTEQIKFSNN